MSFPSSEAVSSGSVAIIMRTRDRLLLLPRALSSVLSQTWQDWHLYLVNDGGASEPVEALLEPYRVLFRDRLTVIHHARSFGMEAASNAALARAREALVVVHDDDDSWHPRFLAAATEFLTDPAHDGFAAVTTGCVVVRERIEGDQVFQIERHPWRDGGQSLADFQDMLWENQFPPICLVFRMQVVRATGPFDATLPVLGDWEFNLRILTQGDIGFIPDRLAFYHQREAGTNSVYSNTTTDHNDRHAYYNVLLRNRALRESFAGQPHLIGQTQALAHLVHREAMPLNRRLEALEAMVFRVDQHLWQMDGCLGRVESGIGAVWNQTGNAQAERMAGLEWTVLERLAELERAASERISGLERTASEGLAEVARAMSAAEDARMQEQFEARMDARLTAVARDIARLSEQVLHQVSEQVSHQVSEQIVHQASEQRAHLNAALDEMRAQIELMHHRQSRVLESVSAFGVLFRPLRRLFRRARDGG